MTNTFQRIVDGMVQPVDDCVDIVRRRYVGWREQDMIAAAAVHRPARRVAGKPAFERCGLDPLIELERGIEWRARSTIGNQFDGLEEAAPTDVADVPVIAEALGQPPLKMIAKVLYPVEQLLFANNLLHLKRRGTSHRMGEVGMSVLESTRTPPDGVYDPRARQHGADRLIAATESFCDGLDVGRYALLFPCVKRARAAHAAHQLA